MLLVARRHLDFATQGQLGFKDRLYIDYGAICLGSGRDDGLAIPIYQDHAFTYRDVAVTLSRLLVLIREYNWQFNALVGVDEDSTPLAIALSQLLEVPMLGVEELREGDFVLLVLAMGIQAELCEVTLEHISGPMLSFTLALAWQPDQGLVTDIVGVSCTGKCMLPWKRIRRRSAEAAATSILRALAVVPEDLNQLQQVAYYTQEHKLLRFFDLSAEFLDQDT